ncbi:hypothetical protein C9J21_21305 [Photobacterium phosphoreum]|nr:hypothetical protein C9J21_21305 [Photobacterium phosphoreum]
MKCSNEKCRTEIDVVPVLSTLNCENNESSGSHTTSYTYTGMVTCSKCGYEHDVTIDTDECDDTGEILSIKLR